MKTRTRRTSCEGSGKTKSPNHDGQPYMPYPVNCQTCKGSGWTVTPGAAADLIGEAALPGTGYAPEAPPPTTPYPAPVAKSGEWAERAAKEIKCSPFKHEFDGTPDTWVKEQQRETDHFAAIILKHAPVPPQCSQGEEIARLTEKVIRLTEQAVSDNHAVNEVANERDEARAQLAQVEAERDVAHRGIQAWIGDIQSFNVALGLVPASHRIETHDAITALKSHCTQLESGLTVAKEAIQKLIDEAACMKECLIDRGVTDDTSDGIKDADEALEQADTALTAITALLAKPTGASAGTAGKEGA